MSTQAMLVCLSFQFGRQSGKDKEITDQVLVEQEAEKGGLAVNKRKICPEAFKPLSEVRTAFRAAIDRVTIPWDIKSMRYCKPSSIGKVVAARDYYGPMFNELKDSHLIAKYDQWLGLTRSKLGKAFKMDEFPSKEELIIDVKWSLSLSALPDAEALRKIKEIDDQLMNQLVRAESDRIRAGVRNGMAVAWGRLMNPIQHMVDVLSKDKVKIHETLVTNVNNILDQIDSININDDPVLYEFASRTKAVMEKIDVEDLRDDLIVRKAVAEKGKALLAAFGTIGKRRIAEAAGDSDAGQESSGSEPAE